MLSSAPPASTDTEATTFATQLSAMRQMGSTTAPFPYDKTTQSADNASNSSDTRARTCTVSGLRRNAVVVVTSSSLRGLVSGLLLLPPPPPPPRPGRLRRDLGGDRGRGEAGTEVVVVANTGSKAAAAAFSVTLHSSSSPPGLGFRVYGFRVYGSRGLGV